MKITKLTIHNFLKLRDVEIDPSKVNVIVGKNKQGKTSILRAIQAAFRGDVDESSIRDAEAKAEITLDLDDYRIERSVTRRGNYLKVSNKDGWQVPAPQKFLDGLIGQFSFNPIDFFGLKSAEKKRYLLQAIDIKLTPEKLSALLGVPDPIVDVDFDRHGLEVISEIYKRYYARRATLNANVSKLEKTHSSLSEQLPPSFDPSTVNEARINELRAAITENEVRKSTVEQAKLRQGSLADEVAKLRQMLADKEQELASVGTVIELTTVEDTAALEKELSTLESQREFVHVDRQLKATAEELRAATEEQASVDAIVKKLGKEIPDQLIREADLPVEGLKVEEDSVTLNGVDIEQLSASEQLTFALQVVRKLNGGFKIICIDGVEILDRETFEWFINEIEKDDFQYFVSRVDGEKGFFVSDGEVTVR